MRAALLACVVVLATGCPKQGSPPADGVGNSGGGGDTSQLDERQACSADGDCAVVEIECCDACNGGAAVGVHKDFAGEVRASYVPAGRCDAVACTLMACEPLSAGCQAGACGIRRPDGSIDNVPLPPP